MEARHPKRGKRAGPAACSEALRIQRQFSLALARGYADHTFKRIDAFEHESKEHGFAEAAIAYSRALWRWVMERTPDDLLSQINGLTLIEPVLSDSSPSPHDTTVANVRYLYRRALFLSGLKYEKAHAPDWYRSFASEIYAADMLGDMGVFQAIAASKQTRRLKKRAGWGHLKFHLLGAWLAGGLWKLQNDGDRAQRLNELLGLRGKSRISERGFKTARERLKLASIS